MEIEEAYKIFNSDFVPREYQQECWKLIDDDSTSGITLLSGTGSGKTEAILIPSLIKNKRLVMIYPARSLVNDQIHRIKKYCRNLIKDDTKTETIILDTGDEEYALQYSKFDDNSIDKILNQILYWNRRGKLKEIKIKTSMNKNEKEETVSFEELRERLKYYVNKIQNFELIYQVGPYTLIEIAEIENDSNYFVRKSKKHYLGGDVILTTIDKFLYRFFGYGEHRWNLLYPYRLYMGELSTRRLVVCFDEAHSYDSVSYTNFINLLSALISNNIKVVVMSATLPQQFLDLAETKFGMTTVKGGDYKGKKSYEIFDTDNRDDKIIELIDNNIGKKTIVVRNTVKNAYEIYDKLRKISKDDTSYNGVPLFFYHGRLFSFVKSKVYETLKEKDDTNEPYLLITTHAIEVGCDLDAEILITDYCNPDQLLQRAGRCARKRESEGRLFILGEKFQEDVEDYLRDEEAYDYEKYIKLLSEYNGGSLPDETIRKETIRHNLNKEELTDALFHFLYSYVYEFDRIREELHKSGILSTRSWIPSAKVFWVKKDLNFEEVRKWTKENSISDIVTKLREQGLLYNYDPLSISIDLLSTQESLKTTDLKENYLVLAVQDSEKAEKEDGYVKGKINPYLHEIYIFYKSHGYPNINPVEGMIQLPKIFEKKKRGIKTELTVKKQILFDSQYDRKIEFLSVT